MWENFVRRKAREWEEMNTDWLQNFTGPLLVLSYSQLKSEVETSLRRTLDFLGVSLTREQLECALKHQEGIYRRRKKNGNLRPHVYNSFLTSEVNKRKQRVLNFIKEKFR